MEDIEWTRLSETTFDTKENALRFITTLKLQLTPRLLEFKVSEINRKFYILYKML